MSILKISNLSKQYRSHWTYLVKGGGVSNVSFEVAEGESFALLGGNGAGKTTTIKCILGLIKASGGEILFRNSQYIDRSKIGFLPEQPYFYQHLSVRETLNLYAGLFNLGGASLKTAVDQVLSKLDIAHLQDRKVKSLSKGQQQRVGIAQAIINDPEFVILDEPFSGLDPLARVEMKQLFSELKAEGKTMMISSHVLSDIEEICDRAIILKNGKTRTEVKIKDLHESNLEEMFYRIVLQCESIEKLEKILMEMKLAPLRLKSQQAETYIIERKGVEKSSKALKTLIDSGLAIREYSKIQKSLEDIFVEVSQEQENA